eukprot:TRINITY_DN13368_c0_g2_i1.p1 TRINITY_DN13368_c0_g2~~TRINITY_DN13368_c0_g2_i1.p1  ORF type:complete len:828 (+),score=243.58 TRINITY_DN13368_c0_g2_i1:1046-3529(+)
MLVSSRVTNKARHKVSLARQRHSVIRGDYSGDYARWKDGNLNDGPDANSPEGKLLAALNSHNPEDFNATKFLEEQSAQVDKETFERMVRGLKEHERRCTNDMRETVFEHYDAFIGTAKEIGGLELGLFEIKQLLTHQSALVHEVAEHSRTDPVSVVDALVDEDAPDPWEEDPEPREIDLYAAGIPDRLDAFIAERQVDAAIALLEEGEDLVYVSTYEEGPEEDLLDEKGIALLEEQLAERRKRLEEQLVHAARQPSVRGEELRAAVAGLYRMGDGHRAHTLLLRAHGSRMNREAALLKPSSRSYGGAYTAAISQLVFSTISQAAKDSSAICLREAEYASELMLWAQVETEQCAELLKRFVLSSSSAAGGLHSASECVTIALGHCSLLEEQGLTLTPVLSRLMRPCVQEAMEANLFRMEEAVAMAASEDTWVLQNVAPPGRFHSTMKGSSHRAEATDLKLSSSAQKLYSMLQDFVEDLGPVLYLQLSGPTLAKIASAFESYLLLMQRALPTAASDEDEEGGEGSKVWSYMPVNIAYEEAQQLALLGNASALADELLPRLATRVAAMADAPREAPQESGRTSKSRWRAQALKEAEALRGHSSRSATQNEHKEWRRRLQKAVDKLRDILCSCLVADFMYGDDGQPLLTADEYLQLDAVVEPDEWQINPMPSPPFQALFVAINAIAATAGEVLAQRERVVTLLLMRLAEWLMMGLMAYSEFWQQLDASQYALGPSGLQQLVLDMYFVMQIAANGKFSSRAMRKVALDSMARGITRFKEQTGEDPNRLLQNDAWFQARCQAAINTLLGVEAYAQEEMYAGEGGDYMNDEAYM